MSAADPTLDVQPSRSEHTALPVERILDGCARGTWTVPVFQRDFLWGPSKVAALMDSLTRDYPIGSLVLWKPPPGTADDVLKFPGEDAPEFFIVDGQQRLTALCLLTDTKPSWVTDQWWEHAKGNHRVVLNHTKGTWQAFNRKDHRSGGEPKTLARDLFQKPDALDEEAQRVAERTGQTKPTVYDRFSQLQHITKTRQIPILKITDAPPDEIATIFERINNSGKSVHQADLVMSVAAITHPDLVRDRLRPLADQLDGWDPEIATILRSLLLFWRDEIRFQAKDVEAWRGAGDEVEAAWEQAMGAWINVHDYLRRHGVADLSHAPSQPWLLPLLTLHAAFPDELSDKRPLAWYVRFIAGGIPAGYNSIDWCLHMCREAATHTTASDFYKHTLRQVSSSCELKRDDFQLTNPSSSRYKAALLAADVALNARQALDWVNGRSVHESTDPRDRHHIFPRKFLRANTPKDDDVPADAIANLTWMHPETNQNVLTDDAPWVATHKVTDGRLEGHLVDPDLVRRDTKDTNEDVASRYTRFLRARADRLCQVAGEVLPHPAEGHPG